MAVQHATPRAVHPAPPAPARTLVLVAGSGRSGTSLIAGILHRLGCRVPAPEVPADETNPRGFAESQWVVDLHAGLLRSARVQTADARPAAWALTAALCLDEGVRAEVRAWLAEQFADGDAVVVKDPRLSWFLPLWSRCAEDLGVRTGCVTMLRHPGAVVDSKQRWYGARTGEVARAAGWLNGSLFTERATRDVPRAFVRYDDLLDDWTRAVGGVATALDLAAVRDAPVAAIRDVHAFVDQGLRRSRPGWGDVALPERLRAQADAAWELLCGLADGAPAATSERLDALRAEYVTAYEEAEALVQSSLAAARHAPDPARPAPSPAVRLARRVPARYRHAVPVAWRARLARAVTQASA
jgi:hypothetical protein